MFKTIKTFVIVFGVCVLLMGLASVVNAAASVTWRVIDPDTIKDKDGVTNLPVGSYVQLWNVTDPDRANHVLLDEAAIGDGFFLDKEGHFSKVLVSLPAGNYKLNIRAYNRPKATAGADPNDPTSCSGTSVEQAVAATDISIHELSFAGFSTTTCPAPPTAVRLTELRGQSSDKVGVVLFCLVMSVAAITGLWYRRRHVS